MNMMKPMMKWLCLQKSFQIFMKDSKEEEKHHEVANSRLMAKDVKVPSFPITILDYSSCEEKEYEISVKEHEDYNKLCLPSM